VRVDIANVDDEGPGGCEVVVDLVFEDAPSCFSSDGTALAKRGDRFAVGGAMRTNREKEHSAIGRADADRTEPIFVSLEHPSLGA
jgi:hypothetical protein